MKITVSGPIGSGKSTVARILAERTGFEYISGGDMFRKSARDRGMTVEEFNVYAEEHPDIDRQQDTIILEILKERDRVVLDSRLSGWLAYNNHIPAFKIYIAAELEERISRVLKREGGSVETVRSQLISREASERKRYMDFYGIDVESTEIYDLVMQTDTLPAGNVAEMAFRAFSGEGA